MGAFTASDRGTIDDVIMPHETRRRVARALALLRNYQFADEAALERIFGSEELKALVEDFNRNFPEVTRTWDKLVLAEERSV